MFNKKQNNNMEITEDYVSFETAKLLKEKGFDEICHSVYDDKDLCSVASLNRHYDCGYGDLVITCKNTDYNDWENKIAAPTLQMARKWLRGLNCIIGIDFDKYESAENEKTVVGFGFTVQRKEHPEEFAYIHNEVYDTNEEAEEAAILYCLNNLIK